MCGDTLHWAINPLFLTFYLTNRVSRCRWCQLFGTDFRVLTNTRIYPFEVSSRQCLLLYRGPVGQLFSFFFLFAFLFFSLEFVVNNWQLCDVW